MQLSDTGYFFLNFRVYLEEVRKSKTAIVSIYVSGLINLAEETIAVD